MATYRSWFRPAIWGIYLAVVLEFLFMISPFALHFYSGYGGALNGLLRWPATAWLTQFFLPHFSQTSSPLLDAGKAVGFLLALTGLVGFVVGAIQVYGAKLLRRGAVTGGLYRWVRHPQYLFLAILGAGVTLIWPRFLVLVSLIAMLFLYAALARYEERDCEEKFGDSYAEYRRRTGLIFPRIARPAWWPEVRRPGFGTSVLLYVVVTLVAVAAGFGLRSFSLSHIASSYEDELAILSPAMIDAPVLREAFELAANDPQGAALIAAEPKLLVYVVPASWYLPDLPIHTEQEIRATGGGHGTSGPPGSVYRVLLARPRLHDHTATARDIVLAAHGMVPLGIARVDVDSGTVLRWDETPDHVIWGDIPTPLF